MEETKTESDSRNLVEQLLQALRLVKKGINPLLRIKLDDFAMRNPSATNCGISVPMTPAAWQAINEALAAAGVND